MLYISGDKVAHILLIFVALKYGAGRLQFILKKKTGHAVPHRRRQRAESGSIFTAEK